MEPETEYGLPAIGFGLGSETFAWCFGLGFGILLRCFGFEFRGRVRDAGGGFNGSKACPPNIRRLLTP